MKARLAPHTTTRRRDRGYASAAVVADTFGFAFSELCEMASGDPVLIRTVRRGGEVLFNWGDALLVSAITTPITPAGGDPL